MGLRPPDDRDAGNWHDGLGGGVFRLPARKKKKTAAAFWKRVRDPAGALRRFEATVPEEWTALTKPDTVFDGRAFERAFRFVVDLAGRLGWDDPVAADTWLVQGAYWIGLPHTWVELPGGVVFDGVLQRFYDRSAYLRAKNARPEYLYSPRAAQLIAERLPRADDGTPVVRDWNVLLGLPRSDATAPLRVGAADVIPLLHRAGLKHHPAPTAVKRKGKRRPS